MYMSNYPFDIHALNAEILKEDGSLPYVYMQQSMAKVNVVD